MAMRSLTHTILKYLNGLVLSRLTMTKQHNCKLKQGGILRVRERRRALKPPLEARIDCHKSLFSYVSFLFFLNSVLMSP